MNLLNKLNLELKFRLVYFTILAAIGFLIAPTWLIFLLVWLGISLFWSVFDKVKVLSPLENQLYTGSLYLYPLLGSVIKFVILGLKSDNFYFWVNRVEHSLWAMALVVLLLPAWKMIYTKTQSKIAHLGLFILVLSVICFFGNLVEFVEFGLRVLWGLNSKYALYYPDTIFDMMSNLVGASLGFGVVWWSQWKNYHDLDLS